MLTAAEVVPHWLEQAGADLPGWLQARTDGELIWVLLMTGVRQPTRERQNQVRRLKRALDREFKRRDGAEPKR